MSVEAQIAQIMTEMARFQGNWNANIQPLLARNPRVPAQFVVDIYQIIAKDIANPILDTQQRIILSKKMASGGNILFSLIGGGGVANINQQLLDSVEAAAASAADSISFMVGSRLAPLAAEAQKALAAGGKTATIGIVTAGADRIDQVVVQTFQAAAAALQRLEQISEIAQSSFLFRMADTGVGAALSVGKALAELGRVLASGLSSVYNSVVGFGALVSLLLKVAIVGGFGYGAYLVLQTTKSEPKQNPSRRRRRRGRPLYLR